MNYSIFVIKIISNPIYKIYGEEKMIETLVKFPSFSQKKCYDKVQLNFWGNHRNDFLEYYRLKDYLIIEGIISLNNNFNEINITVKKNLSIYIK
uniref:hypothetical protein n=1 Tax=Choristocarpus tenellus TaxID=116065 RepID=UPI002E787D50|nr:hypothetical protein V2478_pgp124 [Choristocarpus tenellus]WAM62291.1 hypothetical protein [Choristocarpus tenellus]